jgi:Tol biopolymer transport system component
MNRSGMGVKSALAGATVFLLAAVLVVALPTAATLATGTTTRVSVDSAGVQANGTSWMTDNGMGGSPMSSDGRYVAFASDASNLVPNDTNERDVFVRDRLTGVTTRVSVSSSGAEGNNMSLDPAISANGRYVAFASGASNLVPGDWNGYADVFVHDRQTGVTTLVSQGSGGAQGNADSRHPSISADGRYVAFESFAGDLVALDPNATYDIFVRDLQTGQTTLVSANYYTGASGNGPSFAPSISADGRFVAFSSDAPNLVGGDTNGRRDIFVRDMESNETTRASLNSSGEQALNGASYNPSISSDGHSVAFFSYADNLVPSDTNALNDIFVRDLSVGTTTRVSVDSAGNQATGPSQSPWISPDGRLVAFQSTAANLVAGDTNGKSDVFVADRQTGAVARVSVDSSGAQGNGDSFFPSISGDGQHVAFFSDATNLVVGDTNGFRDAFVHDALSAAKPVYRFRNPKNGYHLWTADEAERTVLLGPLSRTWTFEGIAFGISNNPKNSAPLWRFMDLKRGFHLYTADPAEKAKVLSLPRNWRYEGEAYRVSNDPSGAPVWRFRNLRNGSYFYTADAGEKQTIVNTMRREWKLEGTAYYLAP